MQNQFIKWRKFNNQGDDNIQMNVQMNAPMAGDDPNQMPMDGPNEEQ